MGLPRAKRTHEPAVLYYRPVEGQIQTGEELFLRICIWLPKDLTSSQLTAVLGMLYMQHCLPAGQLGLDTILTCKHLMFYLYCFLQDAEDHRNKDFKMSHSNMLDAFNMK